MQALPAHKQTGRIWQNRPLVPVALAWLGGIAAGGQWPNGWLPASLAGILALLFCLKLKRSFRPAGLVLCLAAGWLAISFWQADRIPEKDVARFAGPHRWQITGTVAAPALKFTRKTRLVLDTRLLQNRHGSFQVCGKLLVNVMGRQVPEFLPGDRIVFSGRIKPFHNFNNPGNFDYRRHMAFKGIYARSYCRPQNIAITGHGPEYRFKRLLATWRSRLGRNLDKSLAGYTPQVRAVAAALLLGDRDRISPELGRQFSRSGVAHVLAISGLHLGLVATGALLLFTRLLAWCRPLRNAGWVQKTSAMAAFAPVAAYALLAGMSPSTQRALIMVAVFLAGLVIGRRNDFYSALALAALVITALHPPALFALSFQLSFTAVLAIVWTMERFSSMVPSGPGLGAKTARYLLLLVMINICATVATLPLTVRSFNQVSLVASAANLTVIPLVGLLVLPAGLAGIFIHGLCPAAGLWLLKLAGAGLVPALGTIRYLAGLEHAAVNLVTPSWPEIGLYYLVLWSLLETKKFKQAAWLLVIAALATAIDSGYWIWQRHLHQDLRLTVVDVGQASCALAELPGGYTILIDGGGFSDNRIFDVGRKVVAPFLWSKKIASIDLVILSHPNSDHLNGLLYILEKFSPRQVWSNHQPAPTSAYDHFSRLIARQKIPWPALETLPRHTAINGVTIDILHPRRQDIVPGTDLNANSMVIRLAMGKISFLLPGDITASAEKLIIKRNRPEALACTVLVAPHHGSRYSSSTDFLKAVSPEQVAISAGYANRFGFPHPQVLARIERLGSKVLRTDCCGAISFITDGQKLKVSTFLDRCSSVPETP